MTSYLLFCNNKEIGKIEYVNRVVSSSETLLSEDDAFTGIYRDIAVAIRYGIKSIHGKTVNDCQDFCLTWRKLKSKDGNKNSELNEQIVQILSTGWFKKTVKKEYITEIFDYCKESAAKFGAGSVVIDRRGDYCWFSYTHVERGCGCVNVKISHDPLSWNEFSDSLLFVITQQQRTSKE